MGFAHELITNETDVEPLCHWFDYGRSAPLRTACHAYVMASASELLRAHLSLVGRAATAEELAIYSDDVVAEFPYAPEDHTRRLEGPDAIARFLENIGKFAEGFRLGEATIHETPTGCIAEYHGDAVFKSTGNSYSQDYISVVTVRDGKIASIKEYYDPLRVLRAMGEIN